MTMSVCNDLNFTQCLSRTIMVTLHGLQDALLIESCVGLRIAVILYIVYANIKWNVRIRINVGIVVGLWSIETQIIRVLPHVRIRTYNGMWKNINAFGLASFFCPGVTCSAWRAQMSPKSLAPSGVNGRSIALIDA